MEQVARYKQVVSSLAAGNALLTDSGYSRHLWRQQFGKVQERAVWHSPAIWSWSDWLKNLWQARCYQVASTSVKISDAKVAGVKVAGDVEAKWLLNNTQCSWLWQQVLQDQVRGAGAEALVAKTWQAWQSWQQWGFGDLTLKDYQPRSREEHFFWACKEQFEALLREKGWLDQTCLAGYLGNWLNQGGQFSSKGAGIGVVAGEGVGYEGVAGGEGVGGEGVGSVLWLAGLAGKLSPANLHLLRAVHKRGVSLKSVPPLPLGQIFQVEHKAFENEEDELLAAVQWARAMAFEDPTARIGLALSKPVAAIPILEQVLHPSQSSKLSHGVSRAAFHVSAGTPLGEVPLIAEALQLLQLNGTGVCDPVALACLLTTREVAGWGKERWARWRHWQAWENGGRLERVSVADLANWLAGMPALACQVRQWQLWASNLSERANFAEWSKRFNQSLCLLGWSGARVGASLDGVALQAVKAWGECLENLGSLSLVHDRSLSWQEARQVLQTVVIGRGFRPQSSAGPISVVGVREAAGLEFDYLWVLGLHGENWPSPEQYNPFLPKSLQQKWDLPSSSAKLCLRSAQRTTALLCRSARQVIFSAPASSKYGIATTPSLLLQSFIKASHLKTAAKPHYLTREDLPSNESRLAHCIHAGRPELAAQQDSQAPQFSVAVGGDGAGGVGGILKGGVAVLRDQSACPFKAFASHRLGIRDDQHFEIGLQAKTQGSLTHRALQVFWDEIKSSAALAEKARLDTDISQAARAALATMPAKFALSTWLKEQEQTRIEAKIALLLEQEKARHMKSPFTIDKLEYEQTLNICGLQLKVRLDRIDKLSDGSLVLLDYKIGGSVNVAQLLEQRPREPQLALYALHLLADKQPLVAFGFAQISEDATGLKIKFKLLEATPKKVLEGKNIPDPNFAKQMEQIKENLEGLATEFKAGIACVAPNPNPDACRYCNFKMLCRVYQHEAISPVSSIPATA